MRYTAQLQINDCCRCPSPLAFNSRRKALHKVESMEIVKDHYMLQMKANSSIEPAFIELMGGRVFAATSSVEDELDTWMKQT